MNDLVNQLKYPVDLYASEPSVNEIGEDCDVPKYLGTLWAGITPSSGKNVNIAGDMEGSEITHLFIVRSAVLPKNLREPYFVFDGEKYHFMYVYLYFKQRDRIQIYCRREEK